MSERPVLYLEEYIRLPGSISGVAALGGTLWVSAGNILYRVTEDRGAAAAARDARSRTGPPTIQFGLGPAVPFRRVRKEHKTGKRGRKR